jgi:outer membrane protein assembly factor BamB
LVFPPSSITGEVQMMKKATTATAILGLLFSAMPSLAADLEQYNRNWPHWRGPAANGLVLEGNPPLEWSEQRNVKWKVPLPGLGHATPVIWENKIFVLTAVPTGNDSQLAFTVLCLDKQTGQTLWQRVARVDTPHQEIQPTNSHSSGSPVTDGRHLVVSFGSYGLYCYDLEGNLLWDRDLGKVQVMWGEGSSPALVGSVVIVLQDNDNASYIYGFDVRTGDQLWKHSRDEIASWTTPYILTHNGRTEAIVNGAKAVRSYDPQTGEVLWQCSGLGVNVTPMVVTDEKAIYAMSGQRTTPRAMAIRRGGSGDLTGTDAVFWEFSRGTPYASSPLLYGGRLYFVQHVTSILTCLDAATGQPHFLQQRLDGITNVYASPIGVNDRIYVVGREGTTLVLENAPELKILARNPLEDSFSASPAVVGNELFLRGERNLYCLVEE